MCSDSANRISHMPFYATTVHSIIHILDFCGLFAIDVLFWDSRVFVALVHPEQARLMSMGHHAKQK